MPKGRLSRYASTSAYRIGMGSKVAIEPHAARDQAADTDVKELFHTMRDQA
jgi:hypothetical protein